MKRNWVIYVAHGAGHELHNCTTESEWFGPYTKKQAERLEEQLNVLLANADDGAGEGLFASAMPLDNLSPRELISRYHTYAKGD